MLIRRDEHQIDKVFRKKLHGAKEEVPLHLWEGVRSNVERRKKLPVLWWWLSGAAIIIGVVFASYHWNDNSNSSWTQVSSLEEQVTGMEPAPESDMDNQLTEDVVSDIKTESTAEKKNLDDANERPVVSSKAKMTSNRSNNALKTDEPLNIATSKPSQVHREKSGTTTTQELFQRVITEYSSQEVSLPVSAELEETKSEPTITMSSASMIQNEILGGSSLGGMNPSKALTQHWTTNRLMVGAWFAQANPIRKPANGSSGNLIDLNQRTKPHTEQAMGIGAGVRVWKGLSVWTGLEKSQFDESHQWRDSMDVNNYSTSVNYEISYPIDGSTPVITAFFDTTVTQTREEVSKSQINSYTSWNVPLFLNWQQPVFKGFFVAAETGPVFRVDRSFRGSFVFSGLAAPLHTNLAADGSQGSTTDYVYLSEYYHNWNLDWHAGLSVGWMSESGFGWNVGLRHRRMVGHTGSENAVSHRIQSTGFNIGLQYRF